MTTNKVSTPRKTKAPRSNKKKRHTTQSASLIGKRIQRRKLRKSVDTCVSCYEERLSASVLVAKGFTLPSTTIPCPPQVTDDYPISSGKLKSSASQRKRKRAKILRSVRILNCTGAPTRINMKRYNSVTGLPNPVGSSNTKTQQALPVKIHMAYDDYLAEVVSPTLAGVRNPEDPVTIVRAKPGRIERRLIKRAILAIEKAERVAARREKRGKTIE